MTRFHRVGMGEILDDSSTLSVLAARLASLSKGYSGIRWKLLERLAIMINERILPMIPSEGSVGASGDLTPLAYIASSLIGEGWVRWQGQKQTAQSVWKMIGIEPLELAPKEALAIMNGTSMMTGLAVIAFARAQNLAQLASRITAWNVLALNGQIQAFHPELSEFKKHPGQTKAALSIWQNLSTTA